MTTSRVPQARVISVSGRISQAIGIASSRLCFDAKQCYGRLFGHMYPATSGRSHIAARFLTCWGNVGIAEHAMQHVAKRTMTARQDSCTLVLDRRHCWGESRGAGTRVK